jgi:hypothetical protein
VLEIGKIVLLLKKTFGAFEKQPILVEMYEMKKNVILNQIYSKVYSTKFIVQSLEYKVYSTKFTVKYVTKTQQQSSLFF